MDLATTVAYLKQALEGQSGGIPAATLKQRVNAALQSKSLPVLNERALGFKKFSELLESQSDWLHITPPTGTGDLLVRLRVALADTSTSPPTHLQTIRSDIWQAFTNPDGQRRRTFCKPTGMVRHFIPGQNSTEEQEVIASPGDHVEIPPILGTSQIEWMREFLDHIELPPGERAAYEAMLSEPYTSGLNLTFTRALGAHAHAWREFRTRRVTDQIVKWAEEAGISLSSLEKTSIKETAVENPRVASGELSPRQQVAKLLEIIADEDLTKVVIPVLLTTILVKSKR